MDDFENIKLPSFSFCFTLKNGVIINIWHLRVEQGISSGQMIGYHWTSGDQVEFMSEIFLCPTSELHTQPAFQDVQGCIGSKVSEKQRHVTLTWGQCIRALLSCPLLPMHPCGARSLQGVTTYPPSRPFSRYPKPWNSLLQRV